LEGAVAAAVRQLEAMRQTVAEETGNGITRHAPGLVVVIQYNDGRREETIGLPTAPPMIDVTPIERNAEPGDL
jgi:hypothetical protein